MNKNQSDSKTFWSLLSKLKAKESKNKDYICSISPFQWVNYFKNLLFQDNSNLIKHAIPDNTELSVNAAISVTEVTFVLKQLKNKKASGLDQLSNEMLKSFGHLYPEFLSSSSLKYFLKTSQYLKTILDLLCLNMDLVIFGFKKISIRTLLTKSYIIW